MTHSMIYRDTRYTRNTNPAKLTLSSGIPMITHNIYILLQRKISANILFCSVSEQQIVVIP